MSFAAGLTATVVSLVGCGDEEPLIRTYAAPKDPPPPVAIQQESAPPMMAPTAARGAGLVWTLPEGWRQEPGTDGITMFRLIPPDAPGNFAVTVTRLGMDLSRDPAMLLSNINRWRGQINLPPIDGSQVAPLLSDIDSEAPGILIDLPGPFDPGGNSNEPDPLAQRILTALFLDGSGTWFIKAHADQVTVSRYEAAYRQLIASVRPAGESATPSAQQASRPTGSDGNARTFQSRGIAGEVPPGWREVAGSSMRLASFVVGDGERKVDIAITAFPGDVGGLLANINRWRGEVGLPPVESAEQQSSMPLTILGTTSTLFQFVAPGDDPNRPNSIVCMVPRGRLTYFIKMMGPRAMVEQQIEPFQDFLRSLRFTDSGS